VIPILGEWGPLRLATHDAFTTLGLLVGLAIYWWELRRRRMLDSTILLISVGAVVGGAIGARTITAWEHLPYYSNFGEAPLSILVEHSGKSLIGAIAGGWIAIVVLKRWLGYTRSTGDCYALAIPVAIVIGRVGCYFSELPLGTPTELPWGVRVPPEAAAAFAVCPGCDLPMHPSMVYEILFNLAAIAIILRFRARVPVQGDTLKLYLLAAGIFRFGVESVRANPVQAFGLTGPQLVLLPLLALLLLDFVRRWRRGVYRIPQPMPPCPAAFVPTAGTAALVTAGPAAAAPITAMSAAAPPITSTIPEGGLP
jgi:prolipoprotein diacylglyceryltransferase